MRALVTGHAGFVGRHMARALEAMGWEVIGCDVADPASPRDVRDMVRQWQPGLWRRPDLVVHCAAVVGGRRTIDGDPLAVAVNLALDSDVVRWCTRNQVPRLVYFSSSAVYPVRLQDGRPPWRLQEADVATTPGDDGMRPDWPDATYGWAKLTGEYLCAEAEAYGVQPYIFRPFSGYGPGQSDDYPMPALVGRVQAREDPLLVWGSGRQVRDWVHIDDVVGAVLAALVQDHRGPLNIGTGVPTSFLTLADMLATGAGYQPAIQPLEDKPAGVPYRLADTRQLDAVYPKRIDLADGVRGMLGHRLPAR